MPQQLQDCIRRLRSQLNEPAYPTAPNSTGPTPPIPPPRFYTDTELTDWLNDGLRDVARRAEVLFTWNTSITIAPYSPQYTTSIPTYALPTDVVRIQRIEFQPADQTNQIYPLIESTQNQMDSIWGTYQNNVSNYPSYWVTRGYQGGSGASTFVLQIFPIPTQGGILNILYYRLPTRIGDPVATPANYTVTLDVTEGWEDMVIQYALARALQKAQNSAWSDAMDDYEKKIQEMVDVTRKAGDQPSFMQYQTTGVLDTILGGGWGGWGW